MLILFSRIWLFVTPWTVARQAPLPMGFSRQEYWSRLPGDHPNPGIKPLSLASSALAVGSLPLVPPAKSLVRSGTEIQNHQRHCEGLIHVDSISFSGSINPHLLLYGSLCICRKPTKHHCFWKRCCLKMNLCPFLENKSGLSFTAGTIKTFP